MMNKSSFKSRVYYLFTKDSALDMVRFGRGGVKIEKCPHFYQNLIFGAINGINSYKGIVSGVKIG